MKIAACLITKGDSELESLKKAVESVAPHVDSVFITANHDHTETKKWCSKNSYHFTYLPWNKDFAEQRNYNFKQAKHFDYVIWLDSDDVLVGGEYLAEIATNAKKQQLDCVFFDYWYGVKFNGEPSKDTAEDVEIKQNRERLINPRSIVWKKRIHETPVPIDSSNFKYSNIIYSEKYPIVWLHLGASRDESKEILDAKMKRNQELLELELEDERREATADPRTLLYLMKIYVELDDDSYYYKCLEMGQEYLEKSGWDLERAACLRMMSQCYSFLGQMKDAEQALVQAIREYPLDPLLYLYLARVYYEMKKFKFMQHWMKIGLSIKIDEGNAAMTNLLELKILASELMLEYHLHAEKNIRKALEAAKTLNKINPTPNNQNNVDFLQKQADLDIACEHIHKYFQYLEDNQKESDIPLLYEGLPDEIKKLPFAITYYNKYQAPRTWDGNEICYYANFGGPHFEKWDGNSLSKGIGGSETAVIRLAEEWTKLGYKVTVYGDPEAETEINGVLYKPWYTFNHRDYFNIFISWRSPRWAGRINAKKFYVDLHDIYASETYSSRIDHIDKIFVKSNYHKTLGKDIPSNKYRVVQNGL